MVEPKRYVRGLRRKPVNVLFPEQQTGKVVKSPSEGDQTAVKPQRKTNVTSAVEKTDTKNLVRKKDDAYSTVQHLRAADTKDQVDGLRFERAFQGDKRLA